MPSEARQSVAFRQLTVSSLFAEIGKKWVLANFQHRQSKLRSADLIDQDGQFGHENLDSNRADEDEHEFSETLFVNMAT